MCTRDTNLHICRTLPQTLRKSGYFPYIESVTEEKTTETTEKAKSIVASLTSEDMTDAEKALVLHDYIVDNTTYNTPVSQQKGAIRRRLDEFYGLRSADERHGGVPGVHAGIQYAFELMRNRNPFCGKRCG